MLSCQIRTSGPEFHSVSVRFFRVVLVAGALLSNQGLLTAFGIRHTTSSPPHFYLQADICLCGAWIYLCRLPSSQAASGQSNKFFTENQTNFKSFSLKNMNVAVTSQQDKELGGWKETTSFSYRLAIHLTWQLDFDLLT